MPGRGTNRILSLEGVTLKDTNLPFGFVSTSVISSRLDEAEKAFLLCGYLQKRKRWGPINYFLYGVFDHG